VQTGSYQDASTTFRLLGHTLQANVLLRRNLAVVSGAPVFHFTLHPDGVARAVDDCKEGQYPIENISKKNRSSMLATRDPVQEGEIP
jgi:hypothetical protein